MIDNVCHDIALPGPKLWAWLSTTTSLTTLVSNLGYKVKAKVLFAGDFKLNSQEQAYYRLSTAEVYLREVYIYCDDKPCWYGRSIVPYATYQLRKDAFAQLGDGFLGSILYEDKLIKRSEFAYFTINDLDFLYERVKSALTFNKAAQKDFLWGRDSIFFIENSPLFLCEVFLPNLVEIL